MEGRVLAGNRISVVACSIHIRPEASRINTRATQYRTEHQQQILQRCVKVYQEFVVTSMNSPVEAWSLSSKAAATLPPPSEAPVFSRPQRHWIQQNDCTQTVRRDEVSDSKASSSTSFASLVLTTTPSVASTVENVGEQPRS